MEMHSKVTYPPRLMGGKCQQHTTEERVVLRVASSSFGQVNMMGSTLAFPNYLSAVLLNILSSLDSPPGMVQVFQRNLPFPIMKWKSANA